MKQQKYDLSIIELGLKTQTFFFFDVMALFYNKCDCDRINEKFADGYMNYRYSWAQTNFDAIPMETRRRLVRILFRQQEFAEKDVDFMDEFYNRIYCTLRTLLGKENVCKKVRNEFIYDLYYCTFEDLISPVTVVKEFLMWHKMGLPVSADERALLQECLQKFLPESQFEDINFEAALKQKRKGLLRQLRHLNARVRRIDAQLKNIDEEDEDCDMLVRKQEGRLYQIYDEKNEILEHLALAEAYPILLADSIWCQSHSK